MGDILRGERVGLGMYPISLFALRVSVLTATTHGYRRNSLK